MHDRYQGLIKLLNEIYDLEACQTVLGWDQQTCMPIGGAEGRGFQQAALARIIHTKKTAVELGVLLDQLVKEVGEMDPDSDEACLIQRMYKEYQRNQKIDPEWVMDAQQVNARADMAWREARVKSDFSIFQPSLEKIVDLARRYACFFEPYEHVYDPLLDQYEPGMKTRDVQSIFSTLRSQQVALIQVISDQPQVDDHFLYQEFPESLQWEACRKVVSAFGYDWKRGRLDVSPHPFTNGIGPGDVRMTTRFNLHTLDHALFSSMHECGHALYELGQTGRYQRTPMTGGTSAAFHESQSRMFENLVGRSLPFWQYFYPHLQAIFREQLKGISVVDFYRGINRVGPSMIRVEADEATYNLHIMLRLELEIGMLDGSLAVADLPETWNDRMHNYLGITPANDAEGVLQDIHWSMGLFGYFSTYALGNLISVQLWERMMLDLPDVNEQMEKGEFSPLLDWLQKKVHQYGKKYEPQVLIERITGSKIDPEPCLSYLKNKYADIYHL